MSLVNLKKILNKQKVQSLLQNLASGMNAAIAIEAVNGQTLLSLGEQLSNQRHPILVSEDVVGWVVGEDQAAVLAELLSLVAKQEAEKKELAKELLERYQEIDLFEDISTQLTTSLETRQIAQLVLQEMSRLIESSAGIILLLTEDETRFETIAEFGQFFKCDRPVPNQGIIGKLIQAGRAELLNDVMADPRSNEQCTLQALICVPLKAKERVLGAIALGTQTPDAYTAEHLKLVSIFASQTAVAIEKALLYEQSCQAAIEAKAQAERLQQALQDLQLAQTQLIQSEKMSSLGQLIAGVAHEINNPVNFISGNLNYVAEYTQDLLRLIQIYQRYFPVVPPELALEMDAIDLDFLKEDLPNTLNSMKLGTNRIVEIVQSLKNFSRHDEAEMKQVNIHDGIDGTLMILRHRLKAAGNRPAIVVVKEYTDLPPVECYAGQLNQVFMNILANAIDALEESWGTGQLSREKNGHMTHDNGQTTTPTITIRTQATDHSVIIRIADNGAGMSEEIMRRIYDPFFTTKEIGKGTGLGMAISHQIIVDKHRGMLKCRSQRGEGTEFWIQIPVMCSTAFTFENQQSQEPNAKAIAPPPTAEESLPAIDADGFITSTPPIFDPTDLLTRHKYLIQRLSEQNADASSSSADQIFELFQHYPIALKLYTVLLSQFCCSLPVY